MNIYNGLDIIHLIKARLLRWKGHAACMNNNEFPKLLLEEKIFGRRKVGRPHLSLVDCVVVDTQKLLETRNWKAGVHNGEDWRI